jgi:hypothetical protein
MIRRLRQGLCFMVVTLALIGSAVLLAWPHAEIEWASGGARIGTGRSSHQYAVQSYGYWPYLTFVEERGTIPSGLLPVIVEPAPACMTGLWLLLLWAVALLILLLQQARPRREGRVSYLSPAGGG